MGARIRVSVSVSIPKYPTLPAIPDLGTDNEITCVDAPACLLASSPRGCQDAICEELRRKQSSNPSVKHLITSIPTPRLRSPTRT
jgi:hypothetical protein